MTKPAAPNIRNAQVAYALACASLPALATSPASLNLLSPLGRAFDQIATGKVQGRDQATPEVQGAWVWEDEDDDDDGQLTISTDGVAIVRITGVLVPWERRWWYGSSLCSTPDTQEALEQVLEGYLGGSIKRCAVYFDTPGGITQGMHSCAQALANLRAAGCPVWAIGPQMCSCGYWLASQANRILLAPDGAGACIGTLILAADTSGWMEQMGVEVNRITSSGAETYKGAGAYGTKISTEQKAMFTRICDETQALFNQGISSGRGITIEEVQVWADGQPWGAQNALDKGMIDEIADPLEALARITDMAYDIEAGSDDEDDNDENTDDPEGPDEDDKLAQRQRTLPRSTRSGKTPGQSRTGGEGMTPFERILAAVTGGSESTDQKLTAAAQAIADLTTERDALKTQLADASAKATTLEESEKAATASRDAFAKFARAQVEAAAVRAFGAGTVALDLAKKQIASSADVASLETLAAELAKTTPASFLGMQGSRITQPVKTGEVGDEGGKTQEEADAAWAAQVAARSKPSRKVVK